MAAIILSIIIATLFGVFLALAVVHSFVYYDLYNEKKSVIYFIISIILFICLMFAAVSIPTPKDIIIDYSQGKYVPMETWVDGECIDIDFIKIE